MAATKEERITTGQLISAAVLGFIGGITLAAFLDYFSSSKKLNK